MRFESIYRGYQCSPGILNVNNRISQYARLGQIEHARKAFDEMPERSIITWNSLIAGYFQNKRPKEARVLFDKMPDRNKESWNVMISGYVKNKMIREAKRFFDLMPEKNVVSWTSMIRGYLQIGVFSEAEFLFQMMPEKNVVTWTVMLGGLIQDGRVDDARKLFDEMPDKDIVARTHMISGYCHVGRMIEAREIFDEMPRRNVISWTTMISGMHIILRLMWQENFQVMPEKNEVSWTAMLSGYMRSGRVRDASKLFEEMPEKSMTACNVMILGFAQTGMVNEAREVFDQMYERDDGSWSTMIKAYERNGFELEALDLFRQMQKSGIQGNCHACIGILAVCSSLATLDHGRQIHAMASKLHFDSDVFVASALMTMYAKCGDLIWARRIFDRFVFKDTGMWNSMITAYAQHGLGDVALQIFNQMRSLGLVPDEITFIGVLSACSYTGRVEEGMKIFESMSSDFLIEPRTEHYSCLVDLFGRAGYLNKAMNLIETMPIEPDAVVWGSLLGACRTHMNLELAELAAKKLYILEPNNSGPYVLLSQMYALKGRWEDVAKLRKKMKTKNVSKSPGCSWLEVDKRVHMFTKGNSLSHPDHEGIIGMLEKLSGMLREKGYSPDGSFVFHDVDEEQKAHNLVYHSEKLAVAFGLLKIPTGLPIRIMKNLRVCGDCHSAIKLIAMVMEREIILRDANRFHHFKDGLCSCKDYW